MRDVFYYYYFITRVVDSGRRKEKKKKLKNQYSYFNFSSNKQLVAA
jgi:hypothetical protein